jgi:hypothetical protein
MLDFVRFSGRSRGNLLRRTIGSTVTACGMYHRSATVMNVLIGYGAVAGFKPLARIRKPIACSRYDVPWATTRVYSLTVAVR